MTTLTREQLLKRAHDKVKSLEFAVKQSAFADTRVELEEELELARIALAAMQQEPETNDRQTLRRLAVILAGNDSPGEIMALTVTAQSFVDRCNQLVAERNALLAGATRQTQRTNRTEE